MMLDVDDETVTDLGWGGGEGALPLAQVDSKLGGTFGLFSSLTAA